MPKQVYLAEVENSRLSPFRKVSVLSCVNMVCSWSNTVDWSDSSPNNPLFVVLIVGRLMYRASAVIPMSEHVIYQMDYAQSCLGPAEYRRRRHRRLSNQRLVSCITNTALLYLDGTVLCICVHGFLENCQQKVLIITQPSNEPLTCGRKHRGRSTCAASSTVLN